jgi:UDP-N-acetylglucosamine 2-epimerase (non-hydrolysing)
VLKRPLIVVQNSTERQESSDAGFANLVQLGPVVSKLRRHPIGDQGLSERLAAISWTYGDGSGH